MAACGQLVAATDCSQEEGFFGEQAIGHFTDQTSNTKDETYNKHSVLLGTGSNILPYVPIDIRSLFCVKKLRNQTQNTNSSNIHKPTLIYSDREHHSPCSNKSCGKKENKHGRQYSNKNDNRSCCSAKGQEVKTRTACIDNFDNFDDPCNHIPESLQNDCAEVCRVVFDNICITKTNNDLKLRLQQLREQQIVESSRILDSVLTYCETRAAIKKEMATAIEEQTTSHFSHKRIKNKVSPPKKTRGGGGGNFRPAARILGEIAFQLERRILGYVLGTEAPQLTQEYGYTVVTVFRALEDRCAGKCVDDDYEKEVRANMKTRLKKILCALEPYGYCRRVHPDFSTATINKYGLLPAPPCPDTIRQFGLQDACAVTRLVTRLVPAPAEQRHMQILLNCLNFLAGCDGRPLMVWG